MKIPEGYLPVMPYLVVTDAAAFIAFTMVVLGATLRYEAPREPGVIMHAELQIEDAVIMLCDATETYKPTAAGIFLYISNADIIYKKALAASLIITVPLEDRPYGRGFGFKDAWNNDWWINTPLEKEN